MNKKDLKRLMELLSKGANINDAEKSELQALQAKAEAVGDEITEADLKKSIGDAVTTAMEAAKGKQLDEATVKSIAEAAVKSVKVPGVDEAALTTKVTEAVKAAAKGNITIDEVKTAIADAIKSIPSQSKMQFEADEKANNAIEFPIAHRAGNLSVAQKQLLNAMTKGKLYRDMDIPDEIINAGIPEANLKTATENGERSEKSFMNRLRGKAITAGGAGTGAEFMNVTISAVLLQRLYLESKFAAAMVGREIQMPSNPYKMPLATTRPVFKSGVGENAAPAGSQPGSAQPTLDAKKLTGMVQYSDEADEDAIIPILPMVTDQLGQAAAEALEDAFINGDTAGSQDTGGAAGDALRLFDGIRKLSLAQTALKASLASGGISAANTGALRKLLGKYGMNPADLIILCGTNGYNDYVLLPETLTAEKAGSQATARILTGTAPSIFGIDIIPSAKVREDLNATGVFDNTTTTKGSVHILHKPSWLVGSRRGFSLETFRDPREGSNYVVASFRRDFKPMESLANIKAAVTGYNYNA